MNKFCSFIRYIFLIILFIFIIMFITKYYVGVNFSESNININIGIILMFIFLTAIFTINLYDLFGKKYKVKDLRRYNILSILGLIAINLVFFRSLFDKSIIINLKPSGLITKDFLLKNSYSYFKYNSLVVIIISALIILYRIINVKKSAK